MSNRPPDRSVLDTPLLEFSVLESPVFDFHVRLAPRPGALESMLATMDDCGIARAAVCSGGVVTLDQLADNVMEGGHTEEDADNEAVLEACAAAGGRLVPFFFANPHRPAARYREQAADYRGLEVSPAVHGVPLTDSRVLDLVEVAAEFQHPVYAVCIGRPGCDAAELAVLAEKYPDVTFILGHCGFVGIDLWSVRQIQHRPNVLAETSGCYTGIAALTVQRLGAERVLFGTEYPLQHPEVELAKLRALRLDPERWAAVMWRNASRVLREES